MKTEQGIPPMSCSAREKKKGVHAAGWPPLMTCLCSGGSAVMPAALHICGRESETCCWLGPRPEGRRRAPPLPLSFDTASFPRETHAHAERRWGALCVTLNPRFRILYVERSKAVAARFARALVSNRDGRWRHSSDNDAPASVARRARVGSFQLGRRERGSHVCSVS